MTRIYALILASSFAIACAEPATNDKGAEENPLTSGKDDSFFRPTEHGTLRMGVANPGTLTEDEQFHAWTFELSDRATIDLSTDVSQNLDTVMYLYRRDAPTDSWGRYIKKNDDDGDNISSRIKIEGQAGEYRVIVKGFKSALRGSFSVNGECTGAGCQTNTDSCDADSYASMPTATQWTGSCGYAMTDVLDGAASATSSGSIGLSQKCSLVGLERKAIDFYHEYWDDIAGFDDQFRYDPDEDVELNFEKVEYRGGTVITVDAGGDEDGLSMFFDTDENLIAAYQHNQSPTVDFYCGSASEAPIEGPDESCFSDVMYALPHDSETTRVSASGTVAELASVNEGLGVAAATFANDVGLAADDVVSYDLITWTSTNGDDVVKANIEFVDSSAEYVVIDAYGGWKARLAIDANGVYYLCD